MKKIPKVLTLLGLFALIAIGVFYFINNEKLPEEKTRKEDDALATKMMTAINNKAFKNTEVLEWSFRNVHHYKWYKQQERVSVSWDNNWVELFFRNPDNKRTFVDNKEVNKPELIKTATDFFNNDSFWLIAPHKVFDEDVERSIVKHNDKDALLVTYKSGGTTPGDSYVWLLDKNNVPKSYLMYLKNRIEKGNTEGMPATWENCITAESGTLLPTNHSFENGAKLSMVTVKGAN